MKHALLAVTCVTLAACTASSAPAQPARGEAVSKSDKSTAALPYERQCNEGIAAARAALAALENLQGEATVASVLEPLNDLWMSLDRGVSEAGLLRNVHPDRQLRDAAEVCEQEYSKIATDVGLSRPLFEAVSKVDVSKEDAVTQRYVKHLLRDFRRNGVDKEPEAREQIRALREELVRIGQELDKNIREDVRGIELDGTAQLEGLPRDYVQAHRPGKDGTIRITTDYPDYIPFMTYAKQDPPRLALYREFRKRGYPANREVLQQLLAKRYELARKLGYGTWADYVTEDKMIKTAQAAHEFIDEVAAVSTKRSQADYVELLQQLRKEMPGAKEVGDWQKAYVDEQLKRDKYAFDSQALRSYFPYERVKQGVLDVTAKLFGVRFVPAKAPVWHPSVEAYEMWDGEAQLGTFFLDMHPREGKYKHAATFPIQSGVAGRRLPEGALVCNFPGGDGSEGLMEHDQVVTFFHELGHLLHHLFGGRPRWVGVSAFNTEFDFVEVPSQVLEEWAWDKAVLDTFARNAAGEPIPDELVAGMRRARDFGKGLQVRHQMFYAAMSLDFYDRDPADLDTTELMKQLQAEYSPFAYVDDTYMQYSFGHLGEYSAAYYTYMWSLVITKDLLSPFRKSGLLSPEVAARYRHTILEPGGSKDAAVMVHDFLGRDYSFDAFADWINEG